MAPIAFPRIPHASLPPLSSSISALSLTDVQPSAATPTSPTIPSRIFSLAKRQETTVAVPFAYAEPGDLGPEPGVVAGIVLGSVAAVLLALWLIYTCFNLGGGPLIARTVEEDVIVSSRSRRSHSPRRTVRSRSRSEVIEVRSPPRRERSRREGSRRRETIILEESRRSNPAPAPPPPEPELELEDDIVEVIEENSPSPPPRRHSRRVERERERDRDSGYRTVDPEQFGGGGAPRRKVRR